jgi:hypothetical protein
LDIGVLDTITCQPLENVFVELWSGTFTSLSFLLMSSFPLKQYCFMSYLANATGIYGGYDIILFDVPPGGRPSRFPGLPGNNPPFAGGNPPLSRNESFLRGGWQTDENGMVELTTIFPGYYPDRAPHIHTIVHKDWKMNPNG